MRLTNFYNDQPLFGLDFGHSNIKVMQLELGKNKIPSILGYGMIDYSSGAIVNGVVNDYNKVAEALYRLFTKEVKGTISTRRVACTLPTSRTFSRPMKLPAMNDQEIGEAVRLEAEQYIPIPITDLYIDYDVPHRTDQATEVLMVATPKNIVDTHVKLLESVGLEPIALEPSMNAIARVFSTSDSSRNEPSILIDLGSVAVDLTVFDHSMFVNSTVVGGSEDIKVLIAKQLNVDEKEAYRIKDNLGIAASERQADVERAIRPILDNLLREIRKIIRYYDERKANDQRKIGQIVTTGGGANMPGLNALLSNELNMPVKKLDPWQEINFGDLEKPGDIERSIYITVAGEAILNPREIFP